MKICDIVMNSVWFDPRVMKQIQEYSITDSDLFVVGLEDDKMNIDEIHKIPGHVNIVPVERKYYRENRTIFTKIKREVTIFRRLKKAVIETGADVIHANDLNALVPAYYAAKKLKCKLIYDTHEIFLENHNIYSSKLKSIFWGYFEKHIIAKVDRVVCVSNAAADYISGKYQIEKSLVVTNCVRTVDKEILSQVKADKFEVLNHGQYYGGRGYDTMVRAAKLATEPNIEYVLRGFGTMEQELRDYVEKEQLNNVRFAPPVKVYELIRAAVPSSVGIAITEPFCLNFKLSVSNKLFEYAAAGLPVIMSDIPEHRYLNEKYNFGIILFENTPECLNEAVYRLYSDRAAYKQMAENSLKMSKELNWENEFQKLYRYECELVGE